MIKFDYKMDANYNGYNIPKRTLFASYLGFHSSGWLVEAEVIEDYYTWIEEFWAFHPVHGIVKGNFESMVMASSENSLLEFLNCFEFEEWDAWDI